MTTFTKEVRMKLMTRICKLNMIFTEEYLNELKTAEEEKKKVEELKETERDELCCMVLTGEWNANVDLDCMKTCAEIIGYLRDEENDVEAWQLAGINAMMDKSNEEHSVDYSMPQAISDILGIRFMQK